MKKSHSVLCVTFAFLAVTYAY